jgi:hypothetical protein
MPISNVRVEIDGLKHSGVNKASRNFFIYQGYASVEGFKHPQVIEFYSEDVLSVGAVLDVPVQPVIALGKLSYQPDFKTAKPVRVAA